MQRRRNHIMEKYEQTGGRWGERKLPFLGVFEDSSGRPRCNCVQTLLLRGQIEVDPQAKHRFFRFQFKLASCYP